MLLDGVDDGVDDGADSEAMGEGGGDDTPLVKDPGWVRYFGESRDEAGWREASSRYVVQLGMERRARCSDHRVCFARTLVTELEWTEGRLNVDDLGDMATQHSSGGATGVIVEHCSGTYLITAQHVGMDDVTGAAIIDNSLASDALEGRGDVLVVPSEQVVGRCELTEIGDDECGAGGIKACKLEGATGGMRLAAGQRVSVGARVRALMHPLGLPMKMSREVEIAHCEQSCCWAHYDNAVGGSGGAVVLADGMLAGLVVGSGLKYSSLDGVITLHRCSRPSGVLFEDETRWKFDCENGQAFVTSETIRSLLTKKFGDGCDGS